MQSEAGQRKQKTSAKQGRVGQWKVEQGKEQHCRARQGRSAQTMKSRAAQGKEEHGSAARTKATQRKQVTAAQAKRAMEFGTR